MTLESLDGERARRALLAVVEEQSHSGCWAWELGTDRVVLSSSMDRLLGLDPGQSGRKLDSLVERVHPVDRRRVAETLEKVRAAEPGQEFSYRLRRRDGTTRRMRVIIAARLKDGSRTVLVGWTEDRTEQSHRDQEIAIRGAVCAALSEWDEFEASVRRLLTGLAAALHSSEAALWAPAGDGLRVRSAWKREADRVKPAPLPTAPLEPAVAAWRTKLPLVRVLAAASHRPSQAVLAVPVVRAGEMLAVITLVRAEQFDSDDRLLATLAESGREIGALLAHQVGWLGVGILSSRELEVMQLAAEGRSGPEIAAALGVSPSTVKSHFDNIYSKYEVSDRAAAVARAVREGLIR